MKRLTLTAAASALALMMAAPAWAQEAATTEAPAAEAPAAEAPAAEAAPAEAAGLQSPEAITGADDAARSVALFEEMGKVITHPRCLNCHPVTGGPTQGDDMHPHSPPMVRGAADFGPDGLACTTCHGAENVAYSVESGSIPGHEPWQLAPESMGWAGQSLADICTQIKDPERNGGRDLEALHEHMAEDGLVGWAWEPGEGRTPAPGNQEIFGALTRAWIDTGAACPV
ncbi:Isoquinoline 1-oxidoreductase subunit [Paracoccus zhejiangensis]|uniref:Isoquinoline 1-oxidoreductase subunit n=1 Tax=Paracoccus zhejiangensis TaxID=1077935 RepID=UPI001E48AC60|nr:Isoquinoline 1-oxidoreductase subunit [Paracoccus zhejiangensis]